MAAVTAVANGSSLKKLIRKGIPAQSRAKVRTASTFLEGLVREAIPSDAGESTRAGTPSFVQI
jgi:hypothetical protein